MEKVCVVGLGYVGLPLALALTKSYSVVGFDIDVAKVDAINSGTCPIEDGYTRRLFSSYKLSATTDPTVLSSASVIFVCVPTPVDEKHLPDLRPLKGAMGVVAECLQKGQMVIVESTIYPGTTEEVVLPILESSGLKGGVDFGIVYCPERIDPGNNKWVLENIPRVLGSLTMADAVRAKELYQSFISAEIRVLNSIKAAEAVKILENTFRDVNIAFINEMAKSFDKLGIDILEVIRGASSKPFGFMPFYPGPGVGGHCIPVDPYYLIERAKATGFEHDFLSLARRINLSMPEYVVDLLQSKLNELGVSVSGAKIGVLGCAYKKGIDDMRESPATKVISVLQQQGASVVVYDPYVPGYSDKGLGAVLDEVDYVVVLTDHEEFTSLNEEEFLAKGIKLVVDGRNCLNATRIKELGISYCGIGRK